MQTSSTSSSPDSYAVQGGGGFIQGQATCAHRPPNIAAMRDFLINEKRMAVYNQHHTDMPEDVKAGGFDAKNTKNTLFQANMLFASDFIEGGLLHSKSKYFDSSDIQECPDPEEKQVSMDTSDPAPEPLSVASTKRKLSKAEKKAKRKAATPVPEPPSINQDIQTSSKPANIDISDIPVPSLRAANETDRIAQIADEKTSELPKGVPKPIMVSNITKVMEFTLKLASECIPDFKAKPTGRFLRILPTTHLAKVKIIDFLKVNKSDFYVVPDLVAPLKVVLHGLPIWTDVDDIKDELLSLKFDVIKITQMTNRRDQRILPLWQIQLPKTKLSREIFNIRSICNITVNTSTANHAPARNARPLL